MFNLSPFGTVKTEPDGTITFAGAVTVLPILQLEGMVQSPEMGGPQESDRTAESTSILGKENPLPES